MQFHHLISSKGLRNIVNILCGIYASSMVIGRVLSGVHWFTDIVGGLLLSATLVMLYYSTNQLVNSKANRSSQRSRWTGCARRWQPRLSLLVSNQGAKATSAFALYISWRNVTQQKLIMLLSAILCRHRTGVVRVFILVPPLNGVRLRNKTVHSDEMEFGRACLLASSYNFLYACAECGHHLGTNQDIL